MSKNKKYNAINKNNFQFYSSAGGKGYEVKNGGVDFKMVDIPYQARLTKLQLDEVNIYRFGMGFNSAQLGDGNITNVVIKSRYALLDLKCDKLEKNLKKFLREMIKVVIDDVNKRFVCLSG